MKITVFGATGGIGGEVVRQALDAGHKVTAVVRDAARFDLTHPALEVATVAGLGFTTAFMIIFTASEKYHERRRRGAQHEHLEQFNRQMTEQPNQQNLGTITSGSSTAYQDCPGATTANGLGGGGGTVDLGPYYLQTVAPDQTRGGVYVQMTGKQNGGTMAQVTCSD